MSKILVTGGAGFLGSNLCARLLESDNQVICVDNLISGSVASVDKFTVNKNFCFYKLDISSQDFIDFLSNEKDIQQIYNFACPASPSVYQRYPILTIKSCVDGLINILDYAKENRTKVLQASTSEVYGDPKITPQSESYWGNVNPYGPRSCYDEGKRIAESLMFNYNKEFGVDISIVRIFNTYGPNMKSDDGRVIPNFIEQAINNQDMTIYGDGTQTRSFCYVDDLIDAVILMMNKDNFTGPVNLGNPQEYTILQVAELVKKLCKSNSIIKFCNLPQDDPKRRRPDISMAKEKLNWSPKISLEEGIHKFLNNILC